MRIYIILLLGLAVLSCNVTNSKNEVDVTEQSEVVEPNYEAAVHFINDYLEYCDNRDLEIGILEWVNNRKDLTFSFKNELARILDEAEKEDTEMGLGFDPILDAQDTPGSFEIKKKNSEYLIVKGTDWPEFQVTLKLIEEKDEWLVDGSGIVNVPKDKRIKR